LIDLFLTGTDVRKQESETANNLPAAVNPTTGGKHRQIDGNSWDYKPAFVWSIEMSVLCSFE
jgi:hypothetical protein